MIPLTPLLYFFLACAGFAALFLFFNLYHVAKFGLECFSTYVILTTYTAAFVVVIGVAIYGLAFIDWSQTFESYEIFPFLGLSGQTGL